MPTNFPTTSIDSYATLVNNVDTINAADVNNPRDAIVAIETILGIPSRRSTTFTPSFTFATTAPTSVTYGGANSGRYAQFGSLVYFSMRLDVSAYSGGSGNMLVAVPLVSHNPASGDVRHIFSVQPFSGFSTNWPAFARLDQNASSVSLHTYSASAAGTTITNSNVSTSGFILWMTGTYFHG